MFIGALLGASAVGMGAFAAHGMKNYLQTRGVDLATIDTRVENCELATQYQLFHALALLAVGILALQQPNAWFTVSGFILVLGSILFCGGIYYNAFAATPLHHLVVPSGGICFIVGWLAIAFGATKLWVE
ncbi:MAG: DUF423 domain-containing protein [Planctomycetales bacterium]|nr:DUF423 domain-containing protein [Planctomycetales bacterium]